MKVIKILTLSSAVFFLSGNLDAQGLFKGLTFSKKKKTAEVNKGLEELGKKLQSKVFWTTESNKSYELFRYNKANKKIELNPEKVRKTDPTLKIRNTRRGPDIYNSFLVFEKDFHFGEDHMKKYRLSGVESAQATPKIYFNTSSPVYGPSNLKVDIRSTYKLVGMKINDREIPNDKIAHMDNIVAGIDGQRLESSLVKTDFVSFLGGHYGYLKNKEPNKIELRLKTSLSEEEIRVSYNVEFDQNEIVNSFREHYNSIDLENDRSALKKEKAHKIAKVYLEGKSDFKDGKILFISDVSDDYQVIRKDYMIISREFLFRAIYQFKDEHGKTKFYAQSFLIENKYQGNGFSDFDRIVEDGEISFGEISEEIINLYLEDEKTPKSISNLIKERMKN